MSHSLGNYRPNTSHLSGDQYADMSIRTASPAKLRLMLLEHAVSVAKNLAETWRKGELQNSNEYSITLLEVLNELLSGIAGSEHSSENELCQQVADLYVFLTKHLVIAEEHSDAGAVDEIRLVLETETETWRAVVAAEMTRGTPATVQTTQSGGLNFSA